MNKRMATYADIIHANLQIEATTHQKYETAFSKFEIAVNLLLQINYQANASDFCRDTSTNSYTVQVLYKYYELPIAVRSCITLFEQGLYSDAFNLIRSLLESLVELKYFYKNQHKFNNYISAKYKKPSKRDMFQGIQANDAYDFIYNFLSKFEHKAFGSESVQLNKILNQNKWIRLTPSFNESHARTTINFLIFIFYGYLNFAKVTFSYDETLDDQKIKAWLKEYIAKNESDFSASAKWHQCMRPIINEQ